MSDICYLDNAGQHEWYLLFKNRSVAARTTCRINDKNRNKSHQYLYQNVATTSNRINYIKNITVSNLLDLRTHYNTMNFVIKAWNVRQKRRQSYTIRDFVRFLHY